MKSNLRVDEFVNRLKSRPLTDQRAGRNTQYTVNDVVLAAFAIFFMQSPSFLAGQRHLEQSKGKSNAETVFQMEQIPTDTHFRNLVDPISPAELSNNFRLLFDELQRGGHLQPWLGQGNTSNLGYWGRREQSRLQAGQSTGDFGFRLRGPRRWRK